MQGPDASTLSGSSSSSSSLAGLNDSQLAAINAALTRTVTLWQGPACLLAVGVLACLPRAPIRKKSHQTQRVPNRHIHIII